MMLTVSNLRVIILCIPTGKEGNFKKASQNSVTGFGVPYDYGSVMHYSEKAFSTNDEPTITVTTVIY